MADTRSVAEPGALHSVVRAALLVRLLSLLLIAGTVPHASWWAIVGPVVIGSVGLALMMSERLRMLVATHASLALLDAGLIALVAAGTGANHPFIATFMTSALLVGLWLGTRMGIVVLDAMLVMYLLVLAPQLGDEPTTGMLVPFVLVTLWWLGYAVQRADKATRKAQQELKRTTAAAAMLQERTRVARDMHDTFAKTLQAISLTASALPTTLDRDPERGKAYAVDLHEMSVLAVREARELLTELRHVPSEDSLPGEIAAICSDWAAANTPRLVTDLDETVDPSDPALRLQLSMALREALENIRRHANAQTVSVVWRQEGHNVVLTIQDDGRGVTDEDLLIAEGAGHFGRRGMAERMASIDGTMTFSSRLDHGTRVILQAPLVTATESVAT